MDPYGFERLTQRVLRECGFSQVEVTKKSGDGGIDGTGKLKSTASLVLMLPSNANDTVVLSVLLISEISVVLSQLILKRSFYYHWHIFKSRT